MRFHLHVHARLALTAAAALAILAPAAAADGTPPVPPASAGQIYVWGNNADGELGTGQNTGLAYAGPEALTLPGGEKAIQVSTGVDHALAVTSDGKLYAWGDNANGDLGQGGSDTTESDTPVQVDIPGVEIASAAAGDQVSYAVTTGGEVYAWGNNQSGQLGDGSQDGLSNPPAHATPALVSGLSGIKEVVATGDQYNAAAFAITDSGEVYAWGSDGGGQLANGDADSGNTDFTTTPEAISGLPPISDISAAGETVLALTTTGDMYGWGPDFCDELDNGLGDGCNGKPAGTIETAPVASTMPPGVTFSSLGFGSEAPGHGFAASPAGNVYLWGTGSAYSNGDYFTPTQFAVPGDAPIRVATASDYCNYAITDGGQLYANGASDDSCGFGTQGSALTSPLLEVPFPASGSGSGVVQVAGDGSYGAAIVGLLPTGPKVTAVSPPSGPLVGGNTVAISGAGFAAGAVVQFGTRAATNVKVVSSTEITATAPAEAAGTIDVIVSGGGGTSSATTADHYTYVNPSVSSVSPSTGPLKGGRSVTVSGNGFGAGATVEFGSHAATHVSVGSTTSLTATAPAGTGTVAVTVKVGSATSPQTSADKFTYVAAPKLSGLSQSKGRKFSFTLDQAATVKLSFALERKRKKPKAVGSITVHMASGHDKVNYKGRKLAAGTYVLTAAATNSFGEKSGAKTLKFTVK
jgi:hypothetical protein